MRTMVAAMLLAMPLMAIACVSSPPPAAFEPNQVWRLRRPPSSHVRVVIDAIEHKGDRTVIRYSIVDSEPGDDERYRAMAEAFGEDAPAGPIHHGVTSMFSTEARWGPGAQVIKWRRMVKSTPGASGGEPLMRQERTIIEITEFATYDAVLRRELARTPEPAGALQDFFEDPEDRFSTRSMLFPVDREPVLMKPLAETLDEIAAWRAARLAPEPAEPPVEEPTPAVFPEADETPFEEAALDEDCRARFTGPAEVRASMEQALDRARRELDERRAALGLPPMPNVSDFEPIYENVAVTMSPTWGPVWRAEMTTSPGADPIGRVRCWRPGPGAWPRSAVAWDPPPASSGEEP